MPDARAIERAWRGATAGARATRAVLSPLAWLFGGIVRLRNAAFDAGLLASHDGPIPVVSVGNLTVGGTGKTPVSAWVGAELLARGARPAIVLRGYGADEPVVHATLNPAIPVVVAADRVEGIRRAAAAGATVAVLDDAFQHRRARRAVDLVLVSADGWGDEMRVLPAGPLREPLDGLRRATAAVVTRKAVSAARAAEVAARVAAIAPGVPVATLHLAPDALRRAQGAGERPFGDVAGARVLGIAAVGDPDAFGAQLRAAGASVTLRAFPDHHAYDAAEIVTLAREAAGFDLVACTLKDAVKLAGGWPAGAPALWYVSQRVVPEVGGEVLTRLLDGVVGHPAPRVRTAGSDRPQTPTHGH